ncbi:hypothetical protein SAMN04489761_0758 [Tenacibaculum sp. MAR_2009_124]|uniref:DUF6263 family protein n=1 Tax=Tenacibaculum sp. MAR_2009_124 TaxID=1250059 RepID=UPI00089861D8|nr:DUF6263 family protein [Tenacibaculum sp. MAR_2009_124]SEB44491.1 hypothetical protein SAMN04489761_0758 [Tenacibaculum sp. MAR_2009_124]
MIKKITAFALLFISTITLAQEKVLLRLNYEKGASYTMDMKMNQIMGAGLMTNKMNIVMNQSITDVSDNSYNASVKFDKMTMDMAQGGMTVSYDSSKSESELDEAGKIMKTRMDPMLKTVITMKGNHLGEVLETKAEPNIPGASDYTNDSSVVYPEHKVAVGDTWTMSKSKNGLEMNFVYKVKSIETNKVVLEIGGKVTGIGEGDIKGSMNIDRKSGVPVQSNIDMTMKIQGQDLVTNMTVSYTKK